MKLPRLYAIADVGVLAARGVGLTEFAESLRDAGVSLVQLRDKDGEPQETLHAAALLREVLGDKCLLIMNDRIDLALLAGFDGVHVGQTDLSPQDAKAVMLRTMPTLATMEPSRRWGTEFVVGVSTHHDAQVREAESSPADYVAIGPVFATGTKADAEPVVGLEGVRRARALTAKPLVAIGGISRANCRSVVEAGADSVAVISGLIQAGESVAKVARDFLDILR
jgi:thiamine-phosphate pyrophosphorylase